MTEIFPFLIRMSQFLLALTVIIGIHEFGHFITAKMTGMRVEKFYIGFPPKILSFRKGDTEYGIGLAMLGGFVKVSGIVDESFDAKKMAEAPKPYEYRAKGPWKRLLFVTGGIIMNLILAIVIYTGITYAWGSEDIPRSEVVKNGVYASAVAKEIGFKDGDKILSINGKEYDTFSDLISVDVLLQDAGGFFEVDRNGEIVRVEIPTDLLDKVSSQKIKEPLFSIRAPYSIEKVMPKTPAEKIGLQENDVILSVNKHDTRYFKDLRKELQENKDKKVELTVMRKGDSIDLAPQVSPDGTLGFRPKIELNTTVVEYGVFESIAIGTTKSFAVLGTQIKAFKKMFNGDIDPTKSVSGPIGIFKNFSGKWDWYRTLSLIGLLSMAIGFMNLLPIPALDGGHMTFIIYEIISGRKPSDKFMERAQTVGVVILLTLMVFVFGNDIWKLFTE